MHRLEKMCVDAVNETIQTIKAAAESNGVLVSSDIGEDPS